MTDNDLANWDRMGNWKEGRKKEKKEAFLRFHQVKEVKW